LAEIDAEEFAIDTTKSRQENFSRTMTEFFIDLRLPLIHVENEKFRKSYAIADSSLVVPSRYQLCKDVDLLYEEIRNNLKTVLEPIKFISLTSDLWTSHRQ
jgi:hypothetical protein